MFQSEFLRFCSTFPPQFEVWVWICLSMVPVFLLLSLCSPFQFLKAARLNDSSRNGDDDESSEVVVVDSYSKASSSSTDEYDVFLSFRGPDTRQGFTDVLYDTMTRAGIRVFRDDDEVSTGQPLEKILRAIETSQICIPIFSRTFAESSWCLREVAKMVELEKLVMPIFYDVTPDDVKLKTGAYRNHLKMHRKKKNGKEQVKVWEDALRQVARIKGKEVRNTRYTEFCKKLVDEGLRKLKPRKRSYDEFLVGIGSQIKSLMKLIDIESPDVRYIGIHGMGGIGKTTLAKALYAELSNDFDCSWFLADVRESSSRCNGLQDLGKQLQEGLDPEFTRGFNSLRDIEERFRRKKVLIVLDDVNKSGQIEKLAGHSSWFGSGSRIIVTTRDLDVLKKLDQNNEVHFFKMMTLEDDQALELFQWHAFREEKPPPILKTISEKIVSTCGGLPLALQVMGSRLYNIKDERVWVDVLERSREVQDRDVKEKLMISFDALENDQKKIFLDIACSDDMKEKVRSVWMWEASKLYPHLCLAILSSMSLIRCDDNEIWMHDLLKELGKGIVREETCFKHSRVWTSEEAVNVLLNKEGQENVEVLCVNKPLELSLTGEHFAKFQELRFLKFACTNIEGDFKVFLPNLAWLTWNYCPQTLNLTNLYMKNLVILNLSESFIDERWGGWSVIQALDKLKDLDLSCCKNLTRTPEFSKTNCLEKLSFFGCRELREIHESIGKLKRLKYLNLDCCDSLDELPDEIGRLVNLEELYVGRSDQAHKSLIPFKLPSSFGNLKSLVGLRLENLGDAEIPDSVGGLVKLKSMYLGASVKVLPESLGDLKSLVDFALNGAGIRRLPNSVGRLVQLKTLRLDGCNNLEALPESLGNLQNLRVLRLGVNKIGKIPMSVGKLKNLEHFQIISIGGMLEEVPIELFCLSSLRSLVLLGSSISTLPSTISHDLPLLERLHLDENHKLQELPDLPLSLKYLSVSSKSLQRTPDLSRLVNLIDLKLLSMDDYMWPQRQPSSKVEGIDKLTKLNFLHLSAASATMADLGSLTQLRNLELDFQPDIDCDSLVPSLDLLEDNSSQASKLKLKLPDLSGLKNLYWLDLINCLTEEDGELENLGIQHLENLKGAFIVNCGVKMIERICLMKNLEDLYVNCGSLGTYSPKLINLTTLESLHRLSIRDCASLEKLENLSKFEKLRDIELINCPKLRIIEGTDGLSLRHVSIEKCESLQNVDELKKRLRID